MDNENNPQITLDAGEYSVLVQQEVSQTRLLMEQNQLLMKQNQMLQELISRTPDRTQIQTGFDDQQKQLVSIADSQKKEHYWGLLKFILMAAAVVLLFYGLYRIWNYFGVLTEMISQYADEFSSTLSGFGEAFGGLEDTFSGLEETFDGLEETMQNIEEFFASLSSFLHLG